MASIVPSGYAAYVRVLHPARDDAGRQVSWREAARWSGRSYHPLMQFSRLRVPTVPGGPPAPFTDEPPEGRLPLEQWRALFAILTEWTAQATSLWVAIWEGHGALYGPRSGAVAAVHGHCAHDLGGAPDAHAELGRWEDLARAAHRAPRLYCVDRRYLVATSPASGLWQLGAPPLCVTPSLVWPEDRAWCVGNELDFDSTLVATTTQCADALLADTRIEAVAVEPSDRVDDGGDVRNMTANDR